MTMHYIHSQKHVHNTRTRKHKLCRGEWNNFSRQSIPYLSRAKDTAYNDVKNHPMEYVINLVWLFEGFLQ